MSGLGWISLYRDIQNHWIFKNDKWFKWWVIMLFEVNHKDAKCNVGYEVISVKRGCSTKSLRTWAKLFDTTPKTVLKFFNLLEKDGMISKKTVGKGKQSTTLINIANYNDYQGSEETQSKRKVNAKETQSKRELPTNNNDNNVNNENNDNNIPEFSEFLNYAKTKKPKVDSAALKLKYDAWEMNQWKDGNNKKIKNWKLKLVNTLPYVRENNYKSPTDITL